MRDKTLHSMELILASGSPRRKQLLEMLGLDFQTFVSDADESTPPSMAPREVAHTLACRKAQAVARDHRDAIVLAADTIVVLEEEILGKPRSLGHACEMLARLSGRSHTVMSGYCVQKYGGACVSGVECTKVRFERMCKKDIEAYVHACRPLDKAGAYGIQERIAAHILGIEGCFYNVMGLPLHAVMTAYKKVLQSLEEPGFARR